MRRTKIVATIGPASESPAMLRSLIDAGMDVARIGLAHGTSDEHVANIRAIRDAAADCGRTIAVIVDLPGPKVRCGEFPEGGVDILAGAEIEIVPGTGTSTQRRITVQYPHLTEDVEPGDHIVLGDGTVELDIEVVRGDGIAASVVHGGHLEGRPGAHLPAERLRLSTPTDDDARLFDPVRAVEPDVVAVSFVRDGTDVTKARELIGNGPLVLAKIETRSAAQQLDAVVDAADAVMVARGDLALECDLVEVPHLQKRIVRSCVERARPVITATQMLESMVYASTPTRAEVSDVANAVFDGADALMLSGETAIGRDPVAAVRTMARIAERAEREADYLQWGGRVGRRQGDLQLPDAHGVTAAMTHAAWRAAHEAGATAILCCTRSGYTVRAMARFRPLPTLVGLSPNEPTVRQLALSWGAVPLPLPTYATTDEMVDNAVSVARDGGYAEPGDVVVVLAGNPHADEPVTDVLRVVRVT